MNRFQILALLALVPWSLWVLRAAFRRGRRRYLLGFAILIGAMVAVVDPDLTQRAAHWLGIGRGADLLIYLTALAVLACLFLILYVHRLLRLQITALTRQIALGQLEEEQKRLAAAAQGGPDAP
jgi:hypothetical protein